MTPKIYVFINAIFVRDRLGVAIAEDGAALANHMSSSEAWLLHDMGVASDSKHDLYAAHYPGGYEVVYVPLDEVETHAGLLAAVERNKALAEREMAL